jgi:hypothetical protein
VCLLTAASLYVSVADIGFVVSRDFGIAANANYFGGHLSARKGGYRLIAIAEWPCDSARHWQRIGDIHMALMRRTSGLSRNLLAR